MLTKQEVEDALARHGGSHGDCVSGVRPCDAYRLASDLQAVLVALQKLCGAVEYEGTDRRWCHLCSGSGEKGGVVWHDNTCPIVNPQLLLEGGE